MDWHIFENWIDDYSWEKLQVKLQVLNMISHTHMYAQTIIICAKNSYTLILSYLDRYYKGIYNDLRVDLSEKLFPFHGCNSQSNRINK